MSNSQSYDPIKAETASVNPSSHIPRKATKTVLPSPRYSDVDMTGVGPGFSG